MNMSDFPTYSENVRGIKRNKYDRSVGTRFQLKLSNEDIISGPRYVLLTRVD